MIIISCITDLEGAKKCWEKISYNERITDNWDFRYFFYKYQNFALYFYTVELSEKPGEIVGLLPLQLDPVHGLEFFAEEVSNYNRPFVKPGFEYVIPDLYKIIDQKAQLFYIAGADDFTKNLPICEYEYSLDLKILKSFDDFLMTNLISKRRRNLSKELLNIEKLNLESNIKNNQEEGWSEYMRILFKFNINTHKEESYLNSLDEQKYYFELLKLPYQWRLAVVEIDKEIQAISLSALYNNIWYYLLTGVNFKVYPGLGKYLQKINIEQAINEKAESFNAGQGDCNWKKLWHLDELPLYEFEYGFDTPKVEN